jgi:nicotinamidase-related amidase
MPNLDRCALVIVDVQKGFDDLSYWGPTGRRNNPACERNLRAHLSSLVRTDALKPELTGQALSGEPDLHAWLQYRGMTGFAVCGTQTNHCVGYEVRFVADACTPSIALTQAADLMTADLIDAS